MLEDLLSWERRKSYLDSYRKLDKLHTDFSQNQKKLQNLTQII